VTGSTGSRDRATLVKVDPNGGPSLSIAFQYNPDTLKRTLQPSMAGGQTGGHSEAVRFSGAPVEMISLNAELEGYDSLPSPQQNQDATSSGIFPLMYALETLIYPPSDQVQRAADLLAQGTIEVAPILAAPMLLVMGQNRVTPVTVQGLEIVEQAYDAQLNPLRAVVTLTLRVISASDVATSNPIFSQYMQYQKGKESLAASAFGS
jgi:hypothetical protein